MNAQPTTHVPQTGFRRRWRELRPGIVVGERTNNLDFWGITFGRPSAFLFLVLFGDVAFITPNLLTWVSFAMLAGSAWLVAFSGPEWWLAAALLMNLNLTLDCADGQLARYRKQTSALGSYLDKVSDYFGFLLLFAALGYACFNNTGEIYYVFFAMVGLFSQVVVGYVKWLAVADRLKASPKPGDGGRRIQSPAAASARRSCWRVGSKIFEFREPDLFLWIGLALVFGRPTWALWLVAVTQPIVMLAAVVYRGWQMTREVERSCVTT